MDQNNKKPNKNSSNNNWRNFVYLIGWALVLAIAVSYAGNYMTSAGRHASSVELEYSEFTEMAGAGDIAAVDFDTDENILNIVPADGYVYTDGAGTAYTKVTQKSEKEGEADFEGFTYTDAEGQEQKIQLDFFTVQIQSNDATVAFLQEQPGNIRINEDYQPPISPILLFFINLMPFLIIVLVMSLLMSWMAKKGMGGMGGIGGVGKANAKVYIDRKSTRLNSSH